MSVVRRSPSKKIKIITIIIKQQHTIATWAKFNDYLFQNVKQFLTFYQWIKSNSNKVTFRFIFYPMQYDSCIPTVICTVCF